MERNNVNVVVGGPVNSDYPKVYNTVFIKPNIPFALQVTEPNTKYVIRHKIDLGSKGDKVSDVDFTNADTHETGGVEYYYVPFTANGKPYTLLDDSCVFITSDWTGLSARTITPEAGTLFMIGSVTGGLHRSAYINADVITMPENCILEFDGGSLDNGVIVGQDTVFINVGDVKIWGDNLTREGTWREHSGGGGEEDKPYDPEAHSGLGRKTLELGEDGSNILTQEDFVQSNTIYVVGYDFDLDGADIQIPEGCVLDFEGGNVTNGRLISNDTEIISQLPVNTNTLYGQYYKDKEPVNYNLRIAQRVNTSVEFAFLHNLDYTAFNLSSQGVCVFYHNNKKYHLVGCYRKEGTTDPEHPRANEVGYMLLFDENYKFLGSAKASHPEHGNGFTVKGNQIYKCTWDGIVVYNISDIVNYCSNYDYNNPQPHSETYASTVPVQSIITTQELNIGSCQDIDYDAGNNEFVIIDGISRCVIYDDNFTQKRYMTLNTDAFIADDIKSNVVFQGAVLKNGILYGTAWISDYSSSPIVVDSGNNIFYAYDTFNDKLVSYEKMETPYQDGECEGLFRNPDDDNEMYFIVNWSFSDSSYNVCAFSKVSQINNLYGRDTKRESNGDFTNAMREALIRVDNSYDYSQGPSNGSSKRPYTTLGSALAMAFTNSGSCIIAVTGSKNGARVTPTDPYYLPNIYVRNKMLTIRGIDGTTSNPRPTLIGAIRSHGANVILRGVRIETRNNTLGIVGSVGGFVFLDNVELVGLGNSTGAGVTAVDNSTVRINNVTASGYRTGIEIRKSILKVDALTVNNCYTGIAARMTDLGLENIHINGCEEGIYVLRSTINLSTIAFENTNKCFCVDDSPINTFGPSAITLTGYPKANEDRYIIFKDPGFRGRVNFMCKANGSDELAEILNFASKGLFGPSALGFYVTVASAMCDGVAFDKGTYIYNTGGFRYEGYPHERVVFDNNRFVYYPSIGTISERPAFYADLKYRGYKYYNTSLELPEYWNGSQWVQIESTPDFTEGVWTKVGELDPTSTTFAGGTVTVVDTEESAGSIPKWNNAQDNKLYRRVFRVTPIPFEKGSIIKLVFKGIKRNTEFFLNYEGGGAKIVIPITYNKTSAYGETIAIGSYTIFNILVRSDIEYFEGTIEVYKKYVAAKSPTIAIIGDSISSYSGTSPNDYINHYPHGDTDALNKMWWKQVCDSLEKSATNCSWSATRVTGMSKGYTASAGCSDQRIKDVGRNGVPEKILILMGINDWAYNVGIGTWSSGDPIVDDSSYTSYQKVETFKEAYSLMLNKLKTAYPTSTIYACTVLDEKYTDVTPGAPSDNANGDTVPQFNQAIKDVAQALSVSVIDLHECGINYDNLDTYTEDGLHPNAAGQALMAQYVINALT